jgi:hypothetical protein
MTANAPALEGALTQVVKRIIEQTTGFKAADLDDDTLLFPELAGDLGVDAGPLGLTVNRSISLTSLDLLDAICGFEDLFGIQYDMSSLQSGDISPASLASPRLIARYLLETFDHAKLAAGVARSRTA